MNVELILERLEGVKARASGDWVARCPAHADRTPSLSIREAEGRVLVHCFAGCGGADVMAAVGLSLADLFDEPPEPRRTPRRPAEPFMSARDVLNILAAESLVVVLAAEDLGRGETLSDEDRDRVGLAWRRLDKARTLSGF